MSGITETIPYGPNCCNQFQSPENALSCEPPQAARVGFSPFQSNLPRLATVHGSLLSWLSQVYRYGLIERLVGTVAGRISGDVEAGLSPSNLDPEETARALVLMTERYRLDAFGSPDRRPSRREMATVFATLVEIWVRTLYG